jgi:hypothetical protein
MRILIFLLSASLVLQAQFKPSSTCKFLTPEEATAVIGAGAKLVFAFEGGGCTYRQGARTLTVAQPASHSNRQALETGYQASARQGSKPLSGIGDRAHIKKGNSGFSIVFLKGNTMAGVEVYGEGTDSQMTADKLIEAAKKVASRL